MSIPGGKCRDTAFADAFYISNGFLNLGRVYIPPGANDQILDSSGNINITLGKIGQIARIKPVSNKQGLRRLRVVVVTRCCRGAAK